MADPPNSEHSQQGHEGYVVDAENAAEMARLVVLQQVLTKAMGGVLAEQSDLSQVRDVLDIACGPGAWVLDVAQQYPDVHLVGIDISQLMIEYANDLAKSQGVAQVRFQVMDATKPLLFPDASFDLVNRLLSHRLGTQKLSIVASVPWEWSSWGLSSSPVTSTIMPSPVKQRRLACVIGARGGGVGEVFQVIVSACPS